MRRAAHLAAALLALGLGQAALPAAGQAQAPNQGELTLNGAIDIHVHQGPDSNGPRDIDADDLARLAKQMGERGLVYKNHWESTAAMAYLMRKQVPGIELFGGITPGFGRWAASTWPR